MKKNKFPKGRNNVETVTLHKLQHALHMQNAKPARQMVSFDPQLQFIISNRYYEQAALKAMENGVATAAHICPTGMGGWSLELYYADREAMQRVRHAYHAECDALGLY